jgi:hypothetical protein
MAEYKNIPTYYVGDTMQIRLKFEHEVNLTDVWANFEREEGVPAVRRSYFTARLRHPGNLRQIDRTGDLIISEVLLEAAVLESHPLPGVYELSGVHGAPSGEGPRESSVLEFDVPKNVRFRVASSPTDSRPKVTHWELGWEAQPCDAGADS